MDPVAFTIFGVDVMWYGLLIAFAMLIGCLFVLKKAKALGYKEDDIYDIILFALPSAIVGARLYYVLFQWSYYSQDLSKILDFRSGGLAIHGGLIGGFLAGYLVCRKKNLKFMQLADIVAPFVALGQAIGRWGNYANQEAFGGPTDLPWAIVIDGVSVHPTFLYESIWNVALFAFLMFYSKKKKFEGEIFFMYLGIYSLGRFWIEGLRTDSLMLGPIRVAQLMSAALIIASIAAIAWFRKNKPLSEQNNNG